MSKVTEIISVMCDNCLDYHHDHYECKECGFKFGGAVRKDISLFKSEFKYCPNCGREIIDDRYKILFNSKDFTIKDDHSIMTLVAIHKSQINDKSLNEITNELNAAKCEGAHLMPIKSPWNSISHVIGGEYFVYLFVQWWG